MGVVWMVFAHGSLGEPHASRQAISMLMPQSRLMEIAILLFDGVTALDAVGPYEVLRSIPGARIRFVAKDPGP
jgi:hypothetical protein